MDPRINPYQPGAGLQPPELAGRDDTIRSAEIDLDRVAGGASVQGLMLLGLRGVGKTVLLNRIRSIARKKDFETIKIESSEDGALARQLAPELRRVLYDVDMIAAAKRKGRAAVSAFVNFIGAFQVKIGDVDFGIKTKPGIADTGDLVQDLPQLLVAVSEAVSEADRSLALFIDEVQYLSTTELSAVAVACHEIGQRGLPMWFVGAGLPQTAALAGTARSYAERLFKYPEIGPLSVEAAREALIKPAKSVGVRYDPDAIDMILRVTERYPYFLQEWGSHLWVQSDSSPIKLRHVQEATPKIIDHLDKNFFRVRFDRLTLLQQKYLRAMAELGNGVHKTGDIAKVLGVATSAVAMTRQQLIEKGMVWSQRHGETAFTVPLFDQFMRRAIPKFEKHVPKRRKKARGKRS